MLKLSKLLLKNCIFLQRTRKFRMDPRLNIKAVAIDLSGTLHIDETPIPGAPAALEKLRKTNLNIKFVSNTTKESKNLLHEKLNRIGFSIRKDEIFTSLTATYNVVKQRGLRPMLILDDRALDEFGDIYTDDPNTVVVGLAPKKYDHQTLTKAFNLLINGAPLIAAHKGRYYKGKANDSGLELGPGAFVTGLEYSADCKAEVVGKPEKKFFEEALKEFGCSLSEAVMIGDDARDDVQGASVIGMKGILVKTGKYRPGDENKISVPYLTTVDNFVEAVDYIIEKCIE